jgi:hypothetical protein
MPSSHSFAILAPVPLEHLKTGLTTAAEHPFVAYGTMRWELLRKLDQMRGGAPVATLIYPSHEGEDAPSNCRIGWFGWYVGHVDSKGGTHPDGMTYRPSSTGNYPADNKGHWAAFWHVAGLRRLPKHHELLIGKVQGFKGGWRKDAPPRGPELITLPDHLYDEE